MLQLEGPIRQGHSELNLLDREAEAKEAEAELILQQVAQDSAGPQHSGGASWRDRQTSSARGSSRQPSGSTDSPRASIKRSVSSTVPRVEVDGALSKTSRPPSRESRGSTPRSQKGAATHAVTAVAVAPPNLEALNGLQRLGVRKQNSQDHPRAHADGGPKEGSEWIQESVHQLKQFAELNKSITRLWKTAVKVDLVSLPPDPRLHSTIGRRSYDEERRAWLHKQETGHGANVDGDTHTVGVAINQFAGLFAEDRFAENRAASSSP